MQLKNRRHCVRRLGAESLEKRELLAGDVMVEVVDGNLNIRGDEASNNILIEDGVHGQYAIIGRPDANGVDTRINGLAGVKVDGVNGNINVRMGDGNDQVEANSLAAPRNLRIGLGTGHNEVVLEKVGVRGNVAISGTGRHLNVDLSSMKIGRGLCINGAYSSSVDAQHIHAGNVVIVGGLGRDKINVRDADVDRTVLVYTGAESDRVGISDTQVDVGLFIGTGTGNDGIRINNTKVDNHVHIMTDSGYDSVDARENRWGSARINTGPDRDRLGLSDVKMRSLSIRSGDGGDSLSLRNVGVAGRTQINTDGGSDKLTISGSKFGDLFSWTWGRTTTSCESAVRPLKGPRFFLEVPARTPSSVVPRTSLKVAYSRNSRENCIYCPPSMRLWRLTLIRSYHSRLSPMRCLSNGSVS